MAQTILTIAIGTLVFAGIMCVSCQAPQLSAYLFPDCHGLCMFCRRGWHDFINRLRGRLP